MRWLNRVSRALALSALAVSSLACQVSTRRAASGAQPPLPHYAAAPYPGGQYPSPAAVPTGSMERHSAPQAQRQFGSALLFLPGSTRQQQVTFETVNGQAVLDGDM